MDEVQRIKSAYDRRRKKKGDKYPHYFSLQRKNEILKATSKSLKAPLATMKILDIGCGNGEVLRYFLENGAPPQNLCGIDLLAERIEKAQKDHPEISFTCKNAEKLPYPGDYFDIITQSTVFTSIKDAGMKKKIASEMLRVLRPAKIIIWHDYRFDNPFNKDVKGIRKKEIMELFNDCRFTFKLMNLNPLIARPLSQLSWKLCQLLEIIPYLRTHWLVVIKKPR